jgi:hypothetical protein
LMGITPEQQEYIGYTVFSFVYAMFLIGSAFMGVQTWTAVSLYAILFIFSSVVVILMVDKFEVPCFRVDLEVLVGTVVGVAIVVGILAAPLLGTKLQAEMGARPLSAAPVFQVVALQFLAVALTESMLKYVWVQGLRLLKLPMPVCVLVPAFFFATLHTFRYGFLTFPFFYTFVMGALLIATGYLPKMLGSEVEFSIYPLVVAHGFHNIAVGAMASALTIRLH